MRVVTEDSYVDDHDGFVVGERIRVLTRCGGGTPWLDPETGHLAEPTTEFEDLVYSGKVERPPDVDLLRGTIRRLFWRRRQQFDDEDKLTGESHGCMAEIECDDGSRHLIAASGWFRHLTIVDRLGELG